jgi:hypothetical protein
MTNIPRPTDSGQSTIHTVLDAAMQQESGLDDLEPSQARHAEVNSS